MSDPNITRPSDSDYYRPYLYPGSPKYDYSKRTPQELVGDVNVLHKFLRKLIQEKNVLQDQLLQLVREKDRLQFQLREQGKKHMQALEYEQKWRKWLWAAMGATWAAVWALFKWMVPYVVAGIVHAAK